MKKEVELYLEKTFYNLCTLNLNDCKTYSEMRVIAEEKYGLRILDPFLPDGSLDFDVDFIDVLRDLNCESFQHLVYNIGNYASNACCMCYYA